jgi:hypothetical protein
MSELLRVSFYKYLATPADRRRTRTVSVLRRASTAALPANRTVTFRPTGER